MAIPFSLRPGDKLTYFPFNAIIKRFHLKMLLNNITFSGRITLKQDIFSLISVSVINEHNDEWTGNLPLFKTFEFRDGIYIKKGLDLMLETNIASDKYEDIVFELEVEGANVNYFHNYFEVFVLGENLIPGNSEKFIYIPSYSDKELRKIIAEGFINEIRIFTHPKHSALSISAFDNLDFETSHHQLWDYYPYATYDDIVFELEVEEANVNYFHNYFEVFMLGENLIITNNEKFIYIPSYSNKELRRIIAEGFINEIRIFTHPKHSALSISAFDNLDFETSHHQLWDYYPYATYDDIVLDVNEVNVEYMFRVYKRWITKLTIGVPGDPDFADDVFLTHPFSFIIGAEFYDKEIRV